MSILVFLGLALLHRLFESVALAVHLKDMTMMRQVVRRGTVGKFTALAGQSGAAGTATERNTQQKPFE